MSQYLHINAATGTIEGARLAPLDEAGAKSLKERGLFELKNPGEYIGHLAAKRYDLETKTIVDNPEYLRQRTAGQIRVKIEELERAAARALRKAHLTGNNEPLAAIDAEIDALHDQLEKVENER